MEIEKRNLEMLVFVAAAALVFAFEHELSRLKDGPESYRIGQHYDYDCMSIYLVLASFCLDFLPHRARTML